MNNKAKLIISIIVCIALFGGAFALYNNLKDKDFESNTESQTQSSTTISNGETVSNNTQSEQTTKKQSQSNKDVEPVPDFVVIDNDGKERKLSEFKGKKVFLNFWATWCGPCKMEMPEFQKAYEKYKDDIEFVIVNVDGNGEASVPKAKSFIEKGGYTFPIYHDTKNNAARAYGVSSIPATYFIDEEGYLVTYAIGALDETRLQKGIDMLLEG